MEELTYRGGCSDGSCGPRRADGRYDALYHTFAVAGASENYKLTVGDFNRLVVICYLF